MLIVGAVVAIGLAAAGVGAPGPTIYGSAYNGQAAPATLYSISPTTGTATAIGPIGYNQVGALAFDSAGTLYGLGILNNIWYLITINTATGVGTRVAALSDQTVTFIFDMDFRPSDGVLFMLGSNGDLPPNGDDILYTINKTTGATTKIGPGLSSFVTDGDGLAFTPGNVLYAGNQTEMEITDQSTGHRSFGFTLNYSSSFGSGSHPSRPNAMKFDRNGTLWAFVTTGSGPTGNTNALGTIDPATGNVSFVGPTTHGMDGIAIGPSMVTTALAHAADGNSFKTMVLLTNGGTSPASYTLRFDDEQGNVPALGFQLETGSLTGTIPAGGSATIRTAGLGAQTYQGWAELTAPPSVGGSVIYSQKTSLPSIQEGTAPIGTPLSQDFFAPFDDTNLAITAIALTNPGSSPSTTITVTLRYSDGTSETLTYPSLAARSHAAFVITTPFPHAANKAGVAEFVSNVPLAVVAFRFNSTGAFTALGAVPSGGSTSVITRAIAHAADGNSFKTMVLLTNASTVAAPYTLRFDDGTGNVPATGFQLEAGALTGTIPPGGSATIRTSGLGPQTIQGWAELTAPGTVGGSVIYSQNTGLPSIQEGTAAIVATGSQDIFIPFDNTANAVTAIALTNSGGTNSGAFTVKVKYSDGTSENFTVPSILARNHLAFVITTTLPHTSGKAGVAEFVSTVPLSAVAFRFNSTGAFTALSTVSH